MSVWSAAGVQGDIGPKLAEEQTAPMERGGRPKAGNLAPKLKLENEKEKARPSTTTSW